MKSSVLLVTFATFVLVLTGCISFPRQEFNRQANASIKKIALVRAREPPEVSVINVGGAGNAFGLIGAAIEISIMLERTKEFTQKMAEEKLMAGEHLTRVVEAELEYQGYEVSLVDEQPIAVSDSEFEYDYSRVTTTADAILHAWVRSTAYVSPAGSSDYVPAMSVCARLISAKDRSQLYFQTFVYGSADIENVEAVPSSGGHAFSDYSTLLARSSEAAEGLKHGISQIGARMGRQLGGRPSLDEQKRALEEQGRAAEARKRTSDAERAAQATEMERAEHWKTWTAAHPGDPCVPALAELKGASECAGAACNASLVLAADYQRNCQPDPETRILVHNLRRRWEKETSGGASN